MSRRLFLYDTVGSVVIWSVAFAASSQGSESPTEAVRGTVIWVISILEDPALNDPAKLMPRRRML